MSFNDNIINMVRLKVGNLTGSMMVDDVEFDVSWTGESVVTSICLRNPKDRTDKLQVYNSWYPENKRWIDGNFTASWVSEIEKIVARELLILEAAEAKKIKESEAERARHHEATVGRFASIWTDKAGVS